MRTNKLSILLIAFVPGALAQAQGSATKTILHNFATPPIGANPAAGLIRDAAGNLYGTTENGGTSNLGTVYKIDPSGRATALHSFSGGNDGAHPEAGVIRDAVGNLYGTTVNGGLSDYGTVYKIDTSGQETVLHSFSGRIDGGGPYAGVILDSLGNLYGTTVIGGAFGWGVVYRIDPTAKETVLYSFTYGSDGYSPYAGVVRDAVGNLYGTTYDGGAFGLGTVYKIDPSGQEMVLHSFAGGNDGVHPYAGVIRDAASNLYGTTEYGGGASGLGTVYRIDASGQETVLHSFRSENDGNYPNGGVIRDGAGNLYGTTELGGETSGFGTVYRIDASGQETVLYSFAGGDDGGYPYAGVVRDAAGNLYGTTNSLGVSGYGTVFRIDPSGQERVQYSFTGSDGFNPYAGVIRDPAGNLYGTTPGGGATGNGTVYRIDPSGHETVLYSFAGLPDGSDPLAGVTRDAAGRLYGTTYYGGTSGVGTVYKIEPSGQEAVVHSFTYADGANPQAGVILDAAGNLYGATLGGFSGYGTVYELDPTGLETVLYSFQGATDGYTPYAGVTSDGSGNLFGTTISGGTKGGGTVFELTLNP